MDVEIRNLQDEALPVDVIQTAALEASQVARVQLSHLTLVFVDDEQVHEINRRFRNVDRPTDVIAFEAEREGDQLTGEVIISVPTAHAQAADSGHGLDAELVWLIAHGVLHVAGMDDTTDDRLQLMLARQRQVAKRMGIEIRS